jgi:hypothetical protein
MNLAKKREQRRRYYDKYRKSDREPFLCNKARTAKPKFIPDSVLADLSHRLSLEPRSLTAAYLGDPPPGYSALDRKNGQSRQETQNGQTLEKRPHAPGARD